MLKLNQKLSKVFLVDESISSTTLEDRISVPTLRTLTPAGQMIVPCRFARTGSQKYLAKHLFRDEAVRVKEGFKPDDVVEVFRDEDTVFDEVSMESFRSAPVTIGHPKDAAGNPIAVTSANAKELQVGVLEGMPARDEDTLGGTLVLTVQDAIDALEDGTQELSAGYACDIVKVDGKYRQRNVRANHIAIVPKGRAGANCRIADEDDALVAVKARMLTDHNIEADEDMSKALALVLDALDEIKAEVKVQKDLVVDFKAAADKAEVAQEQLKVKLADAEVAAKEGVVERCEVIEQARIIADMRDLGDKSTEAIRLMVVEDQMPERDFTGKSVDYVTAMFELLGDSAKGETPMGKLLRKQGKELTLDDKPQVSKADEAKARMISRQSK